MRAANAPAQAPKYVGVAFVQAKAMTTCFGRSGADCYVTLPIIITPSPRLVLPCRTTGPGNAYEINVGPY